MNCPYCNKRIEAMTGLMEVTKFQKHLPNCKKNPERKIVTEKCGTLPYFQWTETHNLTTRPSLLKALEIRAESGQ